LIPEIVSSELLSSDNSASGVLTEGAVSNVIISSFDDGRCKVSFVFNQVMDQVSVHDKLIIENMLGFYTSGASVYSYSWNEAGDTLVAELVSVKEKNLYKLTLPGGENGIKSSNGSYMNKDAVYYFTVNGEQ
jgi:hypothetical protein